MEWIVPSSCSVIPSLLAALLAGEPHALNLWVARINNAIQLFPTQERAWCLLTSWSQLSHIIPSGTTCTTRYHFVRRISHLKPCIEWAESSSVVKSTVCTLKWWSSSPSDYFCTCVVKKCGSIKYCLNSWGCKTSPFDLEGTLSPNL